MHISRICTRNDGEKTSVNQNKFKNNSVHGEPDRIEGTPMQVTGIDVCRKGDKQNK